LLTKSIKADKKTQQINPNDKKKRRLVNKKKHQFIKKASKKHQLINHIFFISKFLFM